VSLVAPAPPPHAEEALCVVCTDERKQHVMAPRMQQCEYGGALHSESPVVTYRPQPRLYVPTEVLHAASGVRALEHLCLSYSQRDALLLERKRGHGGVIGMLGRESRFKGKQRLDWVVAWAGERKTLE
jgi:hypothetical protein